MQRWLLSLQARTWGLAAFLACTAASTSAQTVRTEKNMSMALATQLAAKAVADCSAAGHVVTATVVDRAGVVQALQRADGAGPHTVEASRLKAYTSASAKSGTLAMMVNAQRNPAAANLVNIPGYLLLGGGMPVQVDSEVIGAVGVAGAPGGHLDEQCALAAIAAVKDLLK